MGFIRKINSLETSLLSRMKSSKKPVYNITQQLYSGIIKLFMNTTNYERKIDIVLKISGIWESADEIGITYKFMMLQPMH